jgi:hypothetical protein
MPTATINLDEALKARLTDLANQAGQGVDEFVEAILRRVADAGIRFDRGVPIFRRVLVRRCLRWKKSIGWHTVMRSSWRLLKNA